MRGGGVTALALAGLLVAACSPAPPVAEEAAATPVPEPTPVATPPPRLVPSGTIVAFYGTAVPPGWVLCDGRMTAGGQLTPDLRNRFVLGLDPATGAVGELGGSATHSHRGRTSKPREDDESLEEGKDEHAANDGHTHDVTVEASSHLPPYVKLVYIMKE